MTTPCPKTTFPTLLQQFFLERLIQQRNVSPQTVAAYRDSFCLLLRFAQRHLGKAPEQLALADLDVPRFDYGQSANSVVSLRTSAFRSDAGCSWLERQPGLADCT
jgi:site-specific recombinase XerC